MNVSKAVAERHSVRAFTEQEVSREDIESILKAAQQSPSGGNLQPWNVYVTSGGDRDLLLERVQASIDTTPMGEEGSYDIYPPGLKEPYKQRRRDCGEGMYAAIGIRKEDKLNRILQVMKNFDFFGAPVGLFFTIDETMGRPQWAHMGMYIQTIMLLAQEKGLATCPQEAWALRHQTIREHFDIPGEQNFYCGMALGYEDKEAPINGFRTSRASFAETVSLRGF